MKINIEEVILQILFSAATRGDNDSDLVQFLGFLSYDDNITDIRHAAYMMATCEHETAGTFRPIEEYGKGTGHKYGKVNPDIGRAYYGRGYVQLTWRANYSIMGRELNLDLVAHPELALNPENAYKIMSIGMRRGMFTGRKLRDYLHDDVCDYVNARRIINGLDKAEHIADLAHHWEMVLRKAEVSE